MADRFGRQEPTLSVILPYTETKGIEAVGFYESSGRTSQPWQAQMIYDILSVNKDGLWTHTKFGYSVPRRNGKGEIITIREMYALMTGENVLHTAHRTATSSAASLRLAKLLKSVISKQEWIDLKCRTLPEIEKDLFVGIKYGKDGQNVSMSVSVKTKDGKRFIECIDCRSVRSGTGWILDYLNWRISGMQQPIKRIFFTQKQKKKKLFSHTHQRQLMEN